MEAVDLGDLNLEDGEDREAEGEDGEAEGE